jgi:DNA adenine methylase
VPETLLRWPGGKKRLLKTILPMIPQHRTYVEPFAGGASVFFAKEPVAREVLNDINPELMRFYRQVKGKSHLSCPIFGIGKPAFDRIAHKKNPTACETIRVNRCGYMGKKTIGYACDPKGRSSRKEPRTRTFADSLRRLRHVTLEQGSFERAFRKHDGAGTFTFMDPPYYTPRKANVYDNNKGVSVHPREVCRLAKTAKGKVMVTYNDHPTVRKECRGLNIKSARVMYSFRGTTRGGRAGERDNSRTVRNLIITNYKPGKGGEPLGDDLAYISGIRLEIH